MVLTAVADGPEEAPCSAGVGRHIYAGRINHMMLMWLTAVTSTVQLAVAASVTDTAENRFVLEPIEPDGSAWPTAPHSAAPRALGVAAHLRVVACIVSSALSESVAPCARVGTPYQYQCRPQPCPLP